MLLTCEYSPLAALHLDFRQAFERKVLAPETIKILQFRCKRFVFSHLRVWLKSVCVAAGAFATNFVLHRTIKTR